MNCICRGVPLPTAEVVYGLVIWPNVVPAEGLVHFTFGLPSCARLNRLNTSARKLMAVRSEIGNRFSSDVSVCQMPGARRMFRPALPHWPFGGERALRAQILEMAKTKTAA